jgi:hypothetical protein
MGDQRHGLQSDWIGLGYVEVSGLQRRRRDRHLIHM